MCGTPSSCLRRQASTFGLGLVVMAVGLIAACAAVPSDPAIAAAVFPPWWSARRTFEAAGATGAILRVGGWSAVLIVRSDRPDLAARLRTAGALFTLSPLGVTGCPNPSEGP